jgi:hypothetical protein
MADTSSPQTAPASSPPKNSGGATRLLILLGILVLAVGAYAYDHFVGAPNSEKAYDDIQNMVNQKNEQGIKDGGLVRTEDVQKVVGFGPTFVEQKPDYRVEWYCWWGQIPVLNTWKRYITVVYVGPEPRRYNTHYKNQRPPAEDLPGYEPPAQAAPAGGAEGAPMAEPAPDADAKGEKSGEEKGEKGDAPPPAADAPKAADAPTEGDKPADAAPKAGDAPKEADKPAESPKPAEAPKDAKPAEAPKNP